MIFLCGLNGVEDFDAIKTFTAAIKGTKTILALYQADNETRQSLKECKLFYKDMYYADWDLAIHTLKLNGFTDQNLNLNDSIPHSNQLAGYVGACVAYSFLYGVKPDSVTTANYMLEHFGLLIPGTTNEEKMNRLKQIEQTALDVVQIQ